MSLFNVDELKVIAKRKKPVFESAEQTINKSFSIFNSYRTYDVFLSHSYDDADVILGLCYFIQDMDCSVYLDWQEDPQMNRSKVSKETADTLRKRMKQSKSLIFATSENSQSSKWMPWELGYFDALKSRVAVLPLTNKTNTSDDYKGQEYLGLYDYAVKTNRTVYIHRTFNQWVRLNDWISGKDPSKR